MNFFCIADTDSAIGFQLVGVKTYIANTRHDAEEALRLAKATEGVGIILVTEKVAALIPDLLKVRLKDPPLPLIVEIPSRGQVRKHTSAAELLKELAGVSG